MPFFAKLGFPCPVRKDPASFLQEVSTPKGELDETPWCSPLASSPSGIPSVGLHVHATPPCLGENQESPEPTARLADAEWSAWYYAGQVLFSCPDLRKRKGLQPPPPKTQSQARLQTSQSAADSTAAEEVELLAAAGRWTQDLMVSVSEMCDAFKATQFGQAMREQLDKHPFKK